jgi:hypothetical protein
MTLADHILAARGSEFDLCGTASNVGRYLARAERFEMSDEVVRACMDLVQSRPSTLNAALPMCRLPFDTMWIEYRGGMAGPNNRDPERAPTPTRQGFLIESPAGDSDMRGQVGFATLGWVHTKLSDGSQDAINISPFSIYFDWRPDGDVRRVIRSMHADMLERIPPNARDYLAILIESFERRFVTGFTSADEMRRFFVMRHGWQKICQRSERGRSATPGPPLHAARHIAPRRSDAGDHDGERVGRRRSTISAGQFPR